MKVKMRGLNSTKLEKSTSGPMYVNKGYVPILKDLYVCTNWGWFPGGDSRTAASVSIYKCRQRKPAMPARARRSQTPTSVPFRIHAFLALNCKTYTFFRGSKVRNIFNKWRCGICQHVAASSEKLQKTEPKLWKLAASRLALRELTCVSHLPYFLLYGH